MIEFGDFKLTADQTTVVAAAVCGLIRIFQNLYHKRPNQSIEIGTAALSGASMVPFFLILGSAFSPEYLNLALASKSSIALAGLIGLVFVIGEILSPATFKKHSPDTNIPAANDPTMAINQVVQDLANAMSAAERQALKSSKVSKRIPRDTDSKLLTACRMHLDRDLKQNEKVLARSALLKKI